MRVGWRESDERPQRSWTADTGPLPSFGHCGFLRGGDGGNPLKSRNGKQWSPADSGPLRCGAGRPSSAGPADMGLEWQPSSVSSADSSSGEGYDRTVVKFKWQHPEVSPVGV